jgi:hypothetical protein
MVYGGVFNMYIYIYLFVSLLGWDDTCQKATNLDPHRPCCSIKSLWRGQVAMVRKSHLGHGLRTAHVAAGSRILG